ncbi:hypothetical protein AKJ16_DCAP10188 [Drosera capensis]
MAATALSTFISTLIPKPPPPSPPPPHLTLSSPPIPTITSGLTLNHHPTSVPSTVSPAAAYSNIFYLKHRMDIDYDEEETSWDHADEAIDQFFRELRGSGVDAEWRRRMRFENNRERKIRKAMEAKIKDKWMRIEEREEREVVKTSHDSRLMGGNFFLERIRNEEEQDAQEPLEARAAWKEGKEVVEEAVAYYEGEGAAAYYEGEEGEEGEGEEEVTYYEGEEGEEWGEGKKGEKGEEVVEEVWTYQDIDDWEREFGE